MTTTEAFDPFADDDDDDDVHHTSFLLDATMNNTSNRCRSNLPATTAAEERRHASPPTSQSVNANANPKAQAENTLMNEFNYNFPSMKLDDHDVGDDALFGFATSSSSSHYFPMDNASTAASPTITPTTTTASTFIIAEEMSVLHKSSTRKCEVHVRGTVSLEGTSIASPVVRNLHYCDIFVRDPHGQVLDVHAVDATENSSPGMVVAARDASNPNAFRLTYSSPNLQTAQPNDFAGDHPILEYTCGEAVRPVPMLITTTTIHEVSNHYHQILFTLRVNPRNTHSLLNTVVLVHVPLHIDGARAQVSSVGRSIGRGEMDTTQWNELTRILSWKLGELYSGAVCEFEAIFPTIGVGNEDEDAEPILAREEEKPSSSSSPHHAVMFPVLLRYDCDGSLLSDVDFDFSGCSTPVVKRKFRVYHREV